MKIGNIEIGKKIFILAEAGNNHNGSFETAKQLVREAAKAGADGIKFQTFNPDKYVHKSLQIVSHAKGIHKTQYERLSSLKLEYAQFKELSILAKDLGLVFLSTPFDEDSADFLNEIVPAFKIASGDINNTQLLKNVASKQKPVIMSTGMADKQEILKAIEYFNKDQLILLHCVAKYPVPLEEANLLSIPFLKDQFGLPVGYSDHTMGLTACKAASSMGVVLIEKHFTLDKNQELGDHKLSMDPGDLSQLIAFVRDVEKGLGAYGKDVQNQQGMKKMMRRSLYAGIQISKGTKILPDMLVALRPQIGIPDSELENVVGKKAKIDIPKETLLTYDMIEK